MSNLVFEVASRYLVGLAKATGCQGLHLDGKVVILLRNLAPAR